MIVPSIIAFLNILSLSTLVMAIRAARARKKSVHIKWIITTITLSIVVLILFLTSKTLFGVSPYLTHPEGAPPPFPGYWPFLLVHILMSVVLFPLIVTCIVKAKKEMWESHKKWARWTSSLWIVSALMGLVLFVSEVQGRF